MYSPETRNSKAPEQNPIPEIQNSKPQEQNPKPIARYLELDAARGIAIVLMVIYHFFFDLNYFGIHPIDLYSLPWRLFQIFIGSSFLIIAGISLTIANNNYKNLFARGFKLAFVAALITVATWFYPHEAFIKFGIIHLIAFSTFIAPFFFRFGKTNFSLAILFIFLGIFFSSITVTTPYLFWLGLTDANYAALDHYPVFPWFGLVLFGIALGPYVLTMLDKIRSSSSPNIANPQSFAVSYGSEPDDKTSSFCRITFLVRYNSFWTKPLVYMGRYSLLIYLVHQPILLFPLLYGKF